MKRVNVDLIRSNLHVLVQNKARQELMNSMVTKPMQNVEFDGVHPSLLCSFLGLDKKVKDL